MSQVTVTHKGTVGKRGSERTRHYLSNGWWIDEGGRPSEQRGHKCSLYKPTSGSGGTWVKGANNVKQLLKFANEQASELPTLLRPRYYELDPAPIVVAGSNFCITGVI